MLQISDDQGKGLFPIFLEAGKAWKGRYQNWDLVLSQLKILFQDRAVS